MRRVVKFPRARMVALAVGLGLLSSLATAGPSFAAAPQAGNNCLPDSKIDGNGSTLQQWLQATPDSYWGAFEPSYTGTYPPSGPPITNWSQGAGYISSYHDAVCGSVGADPFSFSAGVASTTNDVSSPGFEVATASPPNPVNPFSTQFAQDTSVAYNYPSAQLNSVTGSGAGLASISCRNSAFTGTDIPYTASNFTNMKGDPGAQANGFNTGSHPCNTSGWSAPYFPQPSVNASDLASPSYPAPGDSNAIPMNFPIGVSAVAIVANLPAACLPAAGQSIEFSTEDMAAIWGGIALTWGNLPDNANDPNLAANCGALAITRVVRNDNSGTTQNFDNYMADAFATNPAPYNAVCTSNNNTNATTYAALKNGQVNGNSPGNTDVNWPGSGTSATGGIGAANANCSAVVDGTSSGGQVLLAKLETISGGVGYADYSDVYYDNNSPATLTTAEVENSSGTFSLPNTGGSANSAAGNTIGSSNCTTAGATTPGGAAASVGTNGQWELNVGGGKTVNNTHDDIAWTVQGSAYPICSLTWDIVYEGLNGNTDPTTTTVGAQNIPLAAGTLTVASDAGFPNQGTITFPDAEGVTQVATYNGITNPTAFVVGTGQAPCPAAGCTLNNVTYQGTLATGGEALAAGTAVTLQPATVATGNQGPLPAGSFTVASTAGWPVAAPPAGSAFTGPGTATVNTSAGAQTLQYGSVTGTALNATQGSTLGTAGSLTDTTADNGGTVTLPVASFTVTSAAGLPSAGSVTVVTNAGVQTLEYSSISGNTLNGVIGGTAGDTVADGTAVDPTTAVVQTSAAGIGGPEPNLTPDQRKNLYAYFTWILSPAGQAAGPKAGYAELPVQASYLDTIRQGFQNNF